MTNSKPKLIEFYFWMVNMRSDKAFKVTIKGVDYADAKKKCKNKFPYPLYKFEHE